MLFVNGFMGTGFESKYKYPFQNKEPATITMLIAKVHSIFRVLLSVYSVASVRDLLALASILFLTEYTEHTEGKSLKERP
jgi:hypothetical protein